MYIRIGYELIFRAPAPVPMTLMLFTHPARAETLQHPDVLHIEPNIPIHEFTDWFGNRCARVVAPAGVMRLCGDTVVADSGEPEDGNPDAQLHAVEDLPDEALQFLLASRYCEVDRMSDIAWNLFEHTPPGWARVQAINDWVFNHIEFGYKYARPTKSAYDVYEEGRGVCRDFMHLAVTFCRCMNIPARYATGYLGDIGVPVSSSAMDFSAFYEAYLGGRWYPFDARHNTRRIGRVPMAYGRDAADVALTTQYGRATLESFKVWTDEVPNASLD